MHDLICEYFANWDVRDQIIELSSLNEDQTMDIVWRTAHEYNALIESSDDADDTELDAIIDYAVTRLI